MDHVATGVVQSKPTVPARDVAAERREWQERKSITRKFDRWAQSLSDDDVRQIVERTLEGYIVILGNHTTSVRIGRLVLAEAKRRGLSVDIPVLLGATPGKLTGRPFRNDRDFGPDPRVNAAPRRRRVAPPRTRHARAQRRQRRASTTRAASRAGPSDDGPPSDPDITSADAGGSK